MITVLTTGIPSGNLTFSMERSTMFNGKSHYTWQFPIANYVKLPEGNHDNHRHRHHDDHHNHRHSRIQ